MAPFRVAYVSQATVHGGPLGSYGCADCGASLQVSTYFQVPTRHSVHPECLASNPTRGTGLTCADVPARHLLPPPRHRQRVTTDSLPSSVTVTSSPASRTSKASSARWTPQTQRSRARVPSNSAVNSP